MDYWAFDIEDRIAVVSPKASAPKSLTLAAVAELSEALNTLGDLSSTVALVVIAGSDDGAFLGDVDRDEFALSIPFAGDDAPDQVAPDQVDRYAWDRVKVTLAQMPQPTVAAIDGRVADGALVVALNCTLRICTERATFGPAELSLGIVGTQSSARLVRLIGPSLTVELLMTKRIVQADEAKRIGLSSDVLPTEGFMEHLRGWCEPIASVENLFEIKRSVIGEDFVARSELWPERPWKGSGGGGGLPVDAATGSEVIDRFVRLRQAADSGGCGCHSKAHQ